MEPKIVSGIKIYILCTLVAAAIFAFDCYVDLGVAAGVPYILVVFISLWSSQGKVTITVSITCSVLTIIGFILSPSGGEEWKVLLNRGIALFVIWITAFLGLKLIKYLDHIREAREVLAKKETASNLISTYNHEINNPLAIVIGNLDLAIRKNRDEDLNKHLEKVKSASIRIGDILKLIEEVSINNNKNAI